MPAKWNVHRRRVVILGAAVLTLLAVELTVRRFQGLFRAYDVALYDRAQDGFRSADHPDIVLLGSSRVRYGFDPTVFEQILCRKAYNVALSGSKIVEWSVLARRIFSDYAPRLVVIGINASEVRYDYVPTEAARHLFNFDDLLESIQTDGLSIDVVGAYAQRSLGPLWKTYDYRYEVLAWGQERLAAILPKQAQLARELRERAAEPRPANGYDHPWSHGRRLKTLMQKVMEDHLAVIEENAPKHRPDAFSFIRLGNLLDGLQSRGSRIIVAYIPNSPRTEDRWRNVEPEITTCIARTCQARGIPFLHWDRDQLPRTDRDYLDETHVGWPLAREISRRVAEQIDALALLEDPARDIGARVASTELER